MAIPVPVSRTKIETVPWGIPITNEVNRLTNLANQPVAWRAASVTQSGIATTWVNVTGMSVSFTAIAGHLYRAEFGGSITGTVAGAWYSMQLLGLPSPDMYTLSTGFSQNNPTWGHVLNRGVLVGRGLAGGAFAAGTRVLQLQAITSSGTAAMSGISNIYVYDLGVDPT